MTNTLYSSSNELKQVRQTLRQGIVNDNKIILQKLYGFELGQMSFYVSWAVYSE